MRFGRLEVSGGLLLAVFGHLAISTLTHVLVRGVLSQEGVPPPVVVAARAAVASIVLLPLAGLARGKRAGLERRDLWRVLVVAALAVPVNQLLYVNGLKFAPATHGALLFCLTPLLVGAFAALIEGVRTPRGAWAGTSLAVVGVGVVMARGLSASLEGVAGRELIIGDMILLGAVVAWSLVTVLSRPLLAKLPSFALSRLLLLVGAAILAPFVFGDVVAYPWREASPRFLAVVVFLGVATSVVAYVLWNVILRRLGPVRCAVLITLQPPCVGLTAWAILDEPVSINLFVGGALVIAGVVYAQRAVARAHADALVVATSDPPLAA